jgi:hypothetical protein
VDVAERLKEAEGRRIPSKSHFHLARKVGSATAITTAQTQVRAKVAITDSCALNKRWKLKTPTVPTMKKMLTLLIIPPTILRKIFSDENIGTGATSIAFTVLENLGADLKAKKNSKAASKLLACDLSCRKIAF